MQRSGVKYETCSWLEEAMLKVHRLRRLERLKRPCAASGPITITVRFGTGYYTSPATAAADLVMAACMAENTILSLLSLFCIP